MGYSIGFDTNWNRDIGYGVPAVCDHPGCTKEINRGLPYVCGGDIGGGDWGCGLFICHDHKKIAGDRRENIQLCSRCYHGKKRFEAKPDTRDWMRFKLKHSSWKQWRDENPKEVSKMRAACYPTPSTPKPTTTPEAPTPRTDALWRVTAPMDGEEAARVMRAGCEILEREIAALESRLRAAEGSAEEGFEEWYQKIQPLGGEFSSTKQAMFAAWKASRIAYAESLNTQQAK